MVQHPLAPDEITVETDPWGDVRVYARYDRWTFETAIFSRAMYCSDEADLQAAYNYRDAWLASGIEPNPDDCYGPGLPLLRSSNHYEIKLSTGTVVSHTLLYCSECNVNIESGCKHYHYDRGEPS